MDYSIDFYNDGSIHAVQWKQNGVLTWRKVIYDELQKITQFSEVSSSPINGIFYSFDKEGNYKETEYYLDGKEVAYIDYEEARQKGPIKLPNVYDDMSELKKDIVEWTKPIIAPYLNMRPVKIPLETNNSEK